MSRAPLSVRAVAELGVLGAMATWAVNFTVVKAAVHAWPVLPFSALRITTAGLVVIAWSHLRGANVRMSRRDHLAASLFGAIGQGIYQLLWAGSLGSINAGTSALLIAVTPFLTAIFAAILRIDPLRPAVAIGGLIAFAGVAAVAIGEGAGAFGGTTAGVTATLAFCFAPLLWFALAQTFAVIMAAGVALRLLAVAETCLAAPAAARPLRDSQLPIYTLIIPLYREAEVVEKLVATGFLRTAEDLSVDDPRPFVIWSNVHETVEQVGASFLGLSLQCARCHGHRRHGCYCWIRRGGRLRGDCV